MDIEGLRSCIKLL